MYDILGPLTRLAGDVFKWWTGGRSLREQQTEAEVHSLEKQADDALEAGNVGLANTLHHRLILMRNRLITRRANRKSS